MPAHKIRLLASFCLLLFAQYSVGQNLTPEFIESSSPLQGGGRVVSRSTPGNEIQTITTEGVDAQLTNSLASERGVNSVLEAPNSGSSSRNADATAANASTTDRESLFRQQTPLDNTASSAATGDQRYPYPAGNRVAAARVASAPAVGGVFRSNRQTRGGVLNAPVRASVGCTNCQVPYQINTLGLTNTVTAQRAQQIQQAQQVVYAPNQCCTPNNVYNAPTALQVSALQQPVLQLQQPAATQVPSLPATNTAFQAPSTGLFQTSPFATTPSVGLPQFQSQQNRWWTPFITGSGAYQPVIRLANIQPGTYLGQGLVGQPTAYVDGQPIRNLFRYVFP